MTQLTLALLPILCALWVWLSPLAFVPVPWPDDSAFYFVGKDFFHWPPRWVMIPQAPFEPTYRIFNFNTMPLYPILIGLGRFIGIDGSFAIKFWPLTAWALTGSFAAVRLFRAGLPALAAALIALAFGLDPIHRWGSVLVRPESLIGLFGMIIVLGLALDGPSLSLPRKFQRRGIWDPISALLALAAYAHFNAIHLLFPVVCALILMPRELVAIGWRAALYLSPWAGIALWHRELFVHQMTTQWTRLAIPNNWLASFDSAVGGLIQGLGSPEAWSPVLSWVSMGLWVLIIAAMVGLAIYLFRRDTEWKRIVPPAAWVFGATWLWHTKPEVWFVYYIHIAIWCFAGVALLLLWKQLPRFRKTAFGAAAAFLALLVIGSGYTDLVQAAHLGASQTWHWSTYTDFIDCIDHRLTQEEQQVGAHPDGKPFSVWNPTFPDVTVELSRRHPDWEFTRTNDFAERVQLALQHGRDVDAVVVAETLGWAERSISAPAYEHPEIQSVWMHWQDYFLKYLWMEEGWKPDRYICQRGRWQAFMFMNAKKRATPVTRPTPATR